MIKKILALLALAIGALLLIGGGSCAVIMAADMLIMATVQPGVWMVSIGLVVAGGGYLLGRSGWRAWRETRPADGRHDS